MNGFGHRSRFVGAYQIFLELNPNLIDCLLKNSSHKRAAYLNT